MHVYMSDDTNDDNNIDDDPGYYALIAEMMGQPIARAERYLRPDMDSGCDYDDSDITELLYEYSY